MAGPITTRGDGDVTIAEQVAKDLADRESLGLEKYGIELGAAMYSERVLLQHLYEELLDGASYLRARLNQIDEGKP